MSAVSAEQIVAQVETLPRLPAAAMRLIRLLHNADSTLEQIVDTVRFDQTITAQMLRACNSAYFALPMRVSSVEDAVKFLGTARVMQLVVAAHTRALLGPPQSGYGLRPGALWEHSVAVAIGTQCLCRRVNTDESAAAFTAGLLHDVGKVVLNEYVGRDYAGIAERVSRERMSFHDAELAELGFSHAEVGALLAERWELPAPIVRAIRFHHEPQADDPRSDVTMLVHQSDALCLLMGVGGGDDGLFYRAEALASDSWSLSERDLEAVSCEIVAELKAVRDQFREGGVATH